MKGVLFLLFFSKLALAENLNALPASPPVTNPRLRPDDMGSFHDPRGSCIRKRIKRNPRLNPPPTRRGRREGVTYKTYCFGRLHQGIDVINLTGDSQPSAINPRVDPRESASIYAIRGGKIVYRGRLTPGLGYTVIVEHKDYYYVLYAHLDRSVMRLRIGQEIARGEQIGNMGASGNARQSPYPFQVHIEIIKAPYFKYRGVKTLKWLKKLGERAYPHPPTISAELYGTSLNPPPVTGGGEEGERGGVVSPHTINSFQSVIPGLSDFHQCPEGEMHCTCPEYHGEKWCHEFDKDLRCPL